MSDTLHFHPDWPHGDGLMIESMARDGRYGSQFVTGVRSLGDEVTPDLVAAARLTDGHDPQVVKRAWHLLARFGRAG